MKTRTQQYIKGERFTWDIDTVDRYARELYVMGFARAALEIMDYVRYECSLEDGETWEMLYADLVEVVGEYYYKQLINSSFED